MRTLTVIADDVAKTPGRLFSQAIVFCATLGLGMVLTLAYTIRRMWQAKSCGRPALRFP